MYVGSVIAVFKWSQPGCLQPEGEGVGGGCAPSHVKREGQTVYTFLNDPKFTLTNDF